MLKNIIAKLVGNFDQRRGADKFHQAENIKHELAEERRVEAKEKVREKLQEQAQKREEPSEVEILGPSDSESETA